MAVPPHKVRGWKLLHNMTDIAIRDQLVTIRQMNLRRIVVACEAKVMERVFNIVSQKRTIDKTTLCYEIIILRVFSLVCKMFSNRTLFLISGKLVH